MGRWIGVGIHGCECEWVQFLAFMNCTCENFDEMQIIFKAITGSIMPVGGKENVALYNRKKNMS